jgi:hypothetical protein
MTCTNCLQTPDIEADEAPIPGAFVERTTEVTTVIGVNGKPYSLNQPLLPVGHFPRTGCSATLTIKGIPRTISKATPLEVFNEAMRLLQLNGEEFWFINLWLNLNLQWIPRVAAKYRIVTVEQLEAISQPTI